MACSPVEQGSRPCSVRDKTVENISAKYCRLSQRLVLISASTEHNLFTRATTSDPCVSFSRSCCSGTDSVAGVTPSRSSSQSVNFFYRQPPDHLLLKIHICSLSLSLFLSLQIIDNIAPELVLRPAGDKSFPRSLCSIPCLDI